VKLDVLAVAVVMGLFAFLQIPTALLTLRRSGRRSEATRQPVHVSRRGPPRSGRRLRFPQVDIAEGSSPGEQIPEAEPARVRARK
jgi:hypothetical protein